MNKYKILGTCFALFILSLTSIGQNKIILLSGASMNMNVVGGYSHGAETMFLRNFAYVTFFERVNVKSGLGLLIMNRPIEADWMQSVDMKIFSFIPYVQPVKSNRISVSAGAGLSAILWRMEMVTGSGQVNLLNNLTQVYTIESKERWRTSLELCFDLDYKITQAFHAGLQGGFFNTLDDDKNDGDVGFFTAGIKVKYLFTTK